MKPTTNAKHTAGPWRSEYEKGCDWAIYGADGYSVLSIPDDPEYGRPVEDRANASLVAAAPDLLRCVQLTQELLTMIQPIWAPVDGLNNGETNYVDGFKAILETIQTVINKAEGRG